MIPLPLAALSFSAALLVQEPALIPAPEKEAAAEDEKQKEKVKRFEEREVATEHVLRAGGAELRYRAAAGTLNLEQEDGAERASIFYVAYALTGDGGQAPEASARPISFCFNGGPGSSSVWLHLGVLGPKRVVLEEGGAPLPPPFRLEDNAHSLLPATDLVFIDPVTTGYSRALPGEDAGQFHGVTEDVEAVGEFVRLWTTRNRRWSSPKFLMGESYGTTRAAALAGHLQDRLGMYLNGIVLVSPILDFRTARFDPGNDLPYVLFLPTYAATAWFHKRLPADLQARPLRDVLSEVERWAATEYQERLAQGDALSAADRKATIATLARYTGLDPVYLDNTDLRIEIERFCKELLRSEKRTVGRLDSRFLGMDLLAVSEEPDFDPSMAAIRPPYTAMFNDYVRRELGFKSDLTYYILGGGIGEWNWGVKNGFADTGESLRSAFAKNPHMKLFVANGFYDLATPYFATRYTLRHLGLDPSLKDSVSTGYYEAGHMMYIDQAELARLRKDVGAFVETALAKR